MGDMARRIVTTWGELAAIAEVTPDHAVRAVTCELTNIHFNRTGGGEVDRRYVMASYAGRTGIFDAADRVTILQPIPD